MNTSSELGTLLRRARQAKGLTQAGLAWAIAQRAGQRVDVYYISQLETGRIKRPDKQRLALIADTLEIPVGLVFRLADYGSPRMEDPVEIPIGDLSKGPGALGNETLYLPKSQVTAQKLVGYRVRGTRMEPEVPEGSLVAVDKERDPRSGDLVVAWTPEGGVVKRLRERAGIYELVGDSGKPSPLTEKTRIEGVVICVIRFF